MDKSGRFFRRTISSDSGSKGSQLVMKNNSNRSKKQLERPDVPTNEQLLLQPLTKKNPAKTCMKNHVCKKEMAVCTSSGPMLTENNISASRVNCSSSNPKNGVVIPDIKLVPPAESINLESFYEYDFPDELKLRLKDILSSARLSTSSESYHKSDDSVTLPDRYRRPLHDAKARMMLANHEVDDTKENDLNRENDITTAIKWIRQEILCMKEQDKTLLKQFLHLHDSIFQLRSLYDMNGSLSDLSSLDGSTYSLNEQAKSPRLHRLRLESSTCAVKLSVSLPNSPRVSRSKWNSRDML